MEPLLFLAVMLRGAVSPVGVSFVRFDLGFGFLGGDFSGLIVFVWFRLRTDC